MAETKPNVFVRFGKGIARFFRDGKAEVKKLFTKPSTVFKNAGIVLLIIVVLVRLSSVLIHY
ncbi:MAG: hypothetical protein ACLSCV_02540 [Acutalibacteraceae bacterium]